MFQKRAVLIAVPFFYLLSGCGSDGSTSVVAKENVIAVNTEFSVHAITLNECGEEEALAHANIILHDKNGKKLSSLQTGSDGKYIGEYPKEARHLTIVGMESFDQSLEITKIKSFIDFNGGNIGKVTFLNNRNYVGNKCLKTEDINADIFELRSEAPDYIIKNRGKRYRVANYTSDSIYLYSASEGLKVDVTMTTPDGSYTTAALLDGNQPISVDHQLKLSDFKYEGVRVDSVEPVGAEKYSAYGLMNGLKFLENGNEGGLESDRGIPFIFPDLIENNFFAASATKYQGLNGLQTWEDVFVRNRVDKDGSVKELILPEFNNAYINAIWAFASNFSIDKMNAEYDFSNVADGMNFVQFRFYWDKAYQERVIWTVQGALHGDFPFLEIDEYIQSNRIPEILVDISLHGFNHEGELDSFRSEMAKASQLSDRYNSDLYDSYIQINSQFWINRTN